MIIPVPVPGAPYARAVDIEEYYDADPRRRDAEERAFGSDWNLTDEPHHRWDLFWNSGTGELYLITELLYGDSLRGLLQNVGHLSADRTLEKRRSNRVRERLTGSYFREQLA